MLLTTLVPGIIFCLAGFIAGDDDFEFLYWYPGRRKLASIDLGEYGYQEPGSDYIDDYVDNYPEVQEGLEEYGPHYRAETVTPEDTDNKRRSNAEIMPNGNSFLRNYLPYTKLRLYNRNKQIQAIEASRWFDDFDHNKDLVIIVHGAWTDEYYVQDFFDTVAFALLQNSDYNIIGIDWLHFTVPESDAFETEKNAQSATIIGHVLNTVVERAVNKEYPVQVPKTCYIGYGMGSIPVVVQSVTYGYLFDSVYGLNPFQKSDIPGLNYLSLTQMHGRLVQTLSTLPNPYSLSHRDYRPIYNEDFNYNGNYGKLAYQILASAIINANTTTQYCSNEDDYIQGYCSKLAKVPLWYRQMSGGCGHPVGRYFFELPGPKLRPSCDCPRGGNC